MDGTPDTRSIQTGETYFCVIKDSAPTFYTYKVIDRTENYADVFDGRTRQTVEIRTHTRGDGVRVEFISFPHTRPSWADQTAAEVFGEEWVAVSQESWTQ